jgi:hypothetical protein
MTATATKTEETWLYAGQRLDTKGKPFGVWVDEAGGEMHFRKLTSVGIPGGAYAVEVTRAETGTTVHGHPRYLAEQSEREPTEAQRERWLAEDRAARATLEAKRAEKAAAASDELNDALEVLRRHRARIRSYAGRAGFDIYVAGEIARPARPDREEDHS